MKRKKMDNTKKNLTEYYEEANRLFEGYQNFKKDIMINKKKYSATLSVVVLISCFDLLWTLIVIIALSNTNFVAGVNMLVLGSAYLLTAFLVFIMNSFKYGKIILANVCTIGILTMQTYLIKNYMSFIIITAIALTIVLHGIYLYECHRAYKNVLIEIESFYTVEN